MQLNSKRSAGVLIALSALASLAAAATGCSTGRTETPVSEYSSVFARRLFDGLSEVVEFDRLSEPQASRIFGYAGVALYEALVPGMEEFESLEDQLNGYTDPPEPDKGREYHWPTAANQAVGTLLQRMFAASSENAREMVAELVHDGEELAMGSVEPEVLARSRKFGVEIGDYIYQWSLGDGFTTLRGCEYPVPQGQGLWSPAPPALLPPVEPCWGRLRPLAIASGKEFQPPAPVPFSAGKDSLLYRAATELYNASAALTPEQRHTALFWADPPGETATPAGHSIGVITGLLDEYDKDLEVAAEAYARAGIAVADSFISAWNSKYTYNTASPVTYIRQTMDPGWSPLVATPAYPEYTSAHAVQAGAVAEVLKFVFADEPFGDRVNERHGMGIRYFTTFSSWAQEAALGQFYAGISYKHSVEAGLVEGRSIGLKANSLRMKTRTVAPTAVPD
jgi:hypothetical protein